MSRALRKQQLSDQTSITAGTMFDHSRVALTKWFAAIYLIGTDRGGVSVLRISKLIGVQ